MAPGKSRVTVALIASDKERQSEPAGNDLVPTTGLLTSHPSPYRNSRVQSTLQRGEHVPVQTCCHLQQPVRGPCWPARMRHYAGRQFLCCTNQEPPAKVCRVMVSTSGLPPNSAKARLVSPARKCPRKARAVETFRLTWYTRWR